MFRILGVIQKKRICCYSLEDVGVKEKLAGDAFYKRLVRFISIFYVFFPKRMKKDNSIRILEL